MAEKEKSKKKKLLGRLIRKETLPGKKETVIETKDNIEDPFGVIDFVLMTEKAIQMIESQNKLSFIVSRKASKQEIAKAVESIFSESVASVTTQIDQKNRKKATVKFEKEGIAGEIAIRLGII